MTKDWQQRIQGLLSTALTNESSITPRLDQAMRYSALNGGKRIRPLLVYMTGELLGCEAEQLDSAACAVEFIHCYSLIHDDLPAMDDDDLRRGQPSCHKAFDEATAILAGDALQTLAFETLADKTLSPSLSDNQRLQMIALLSRASGAQGMVGGQTLDVLATAQQQSQEQLDQMHLLKTGALIRACIKLAAIAAEANPSTQKLLDDFGLAIGLAFQIQDDILDVEGNTELLGKTQGMDDAKQKSTYISVCGLEKAKARAKQLYQRATTLLGQLDKQLNPQQNNLQHFVDSLLDRRY